MNTLIYHIFNRNKRVCYWNLEQLRQRIHLFDRCYVKIASLSSRKTKKFVASDLTFLPRDSEIFVFENDRNRREGVEFLKLVERAITTDPAGYTFYAHTKGSSVIWRSSKRKCLGNILSWAEAMYRLNLDYPERLGALWQDGYSCIGALKRVEEHDGSSWHFAGSFYWLRNQAVLQSDWKNASGSRFITESFPGRLFPSEKACCLFTPGEQRNLYHHGVDSEELGETLNAMAVGK